MAESKVRTKPIDTTATTPQAFLDGTSAPPLVTPPPTAPVTTPPEQTTSPETPVQQTKIISTPGSAPVPAPAPGEDLLSVPDPFVPMAKWASANPVIFRSLRGMNVPGGVVLKYTFLGAQMGETMCFVPGVKVEGGKLIAL